jgi:HSP20 family molecular chaperone IbpA
MSANSRHVADGHDVFARRYQYGDETVIAVDFGVAEGTTSVDVVDGTAIVVVETPEGSRQEEFELPDEGARAFIRNGVLTIEVSP